MVSGFFNPRRAGSGPTGPFLAEDEFKAHALGLTPDGAPCARGPLTAPELFGPFQLQNFSSRFQRAGSPSSDHPNPGRVSGLRGLYLLKRGASTFFKSPEVQQTPSRTSEQNHSPLNGFREPLVPAASVTRTPAGLLRRLPEQHLLR